MDYHFVLLQSFIKRQLKKHKEEICWKMVEEDAILRMSRLLDASEFDAGAMLICQMFIRQFVTAYTNSGGDQVLSRPDKQQILDNCMKFASETLVRAMAERVMYPEKEKEHGRDTD